VECGDLERDVRDIWEEEGRVRTESLESTNLRVSGREKEGKEGDLEKRTYSIQGKAS